MFEIPLGNLCRVETRIFRLGTFTQGQHPRSFIQPKKITDQYFLLTNRPKRFKGKNNGGRVSSEMAGGKQSSESGQMRKDIDSTQRGRVFSFQVLGSMLDYVWNVSSKTGIMTTSDNFTACHTGSGQMLNKSLLSFFYQYTFLFPRVMFIRPMLNSNLQINVCILLNILRSPSISQYSCKLNQSY